MFELKARGSLAIGGGATYYFNEHIGVEGRIDTVDFKIDTVAPIFVASVELPAPLPPLNAELDLGAGIVDVERLYPLSVNLKARTGGDTRFFASGGLSYLPRLRFSATQTVGLGVSGCGFTSIDIASVDVGAEALAGEEGQLGFNGGAGAEIRVGDNVAIVVEGRVFWFQQVSFVWRRISAPVSELEELLLEELESQLPAIEFEPVYFQATGGLAFRF